MRLNLHDIINIPGKEVSFNYELDVSEYSFPGIEKFNGPLKVEGNVKNVAGVLECHSNAVGSMTCICARCANTFEKPIDVKSNATIADEIFDEENSDIYLLDGDEIDIDEIVLTDFVLKMDTRFLCNPDCKGLCAGCGVNLNTEKCKCQKEVDPRLAVLAQFFEDN